MPLERLMSEFAYIGVVLLLLYILLGYRKPALAFTTVPIAAFVLLYVAIETEAPEVLVLAPLVFVSTLVSITASGLRPESRQWFHWWAWWLLLAIVAILLAGALLAGIGFATGGYVLPIIFVLGIIGFFISLVHYSVTSQRITVQSIFSTLGASMRQNLPLPMALECAAHGRQDTTGFFLRAIKSWLVQGYSLTEAMRRGYPSCPSRALAVLAAGERIDQLPAALRAIEKDLRANQMERRRLQPVHPLYPVAMLCFAFLVVLTIMRFVMPAYGDMLQEMVGGKLPPATRALLGITQALVHPRTLWGPLVVLVTVVGGLVLYRLSRKRRPAAPYPHTWIIDSLKWFLPITHWFERNRAMVQVVELLRLSLNAGRPVNEAIRSTLQLDVNVLFRSRLICWLRRVERGENIGESARRCGLGAALAWAFEGGADPGTPTVLEMLESYYRSNYSYRVNLTRFILWPLGIIALGATVGFIVFAIFSPLVAVLRSLSGVVYP
jgi:type II secretory pathway component PulF